MRLNDKVGPQASELEQNSNLKSGAAKIPESRSDGWPLAKRFSQLQMEIVSMGSPGGPKGKASYDSGVEFAWNPVQWNGSYEITIKTQMGDWHLKKA